MTAKKTPVGGKGTVAEGLIQIDEEQIRLIYSLPGGKPPEDFTTKENQQMFVLAKPKDE